VSGGPEPELARVFIGLALGPELGETALGAVALALGVRAARDWRLPRAAGLHVTLLFLGDVPRAALAGLGERLGEELGGRPAPRLVLDRAGAFPRRGAERVLWLGIAEEPGSEGRLADLHGRALRAARRAGLGLAPDAQRPFQPHVTVARPRRVRGRAEGRAPAAFFALAPELAFAPAEVALFESTPAPDGPPLYARLAAVPLAASAR
jgi:2'-5' RNA ligase